MVTTVTLNPCVDITVMLSGLKVGESNLTKSVQSRLGGKGINAAIMLQRLGVPCICSGIAFSDRAAELDTMLREQGIGSEFINTSGSVRTNIKIMDTENGVMTELNGRGDKVSSRTLRSLEDMLSRIIEGSEILILGGSLPQGCPDDTYRRIIRRLRGKPLRVVVDTSGQPLLEAVKEKPFLIKPNLTELKNTFGCVGDDLGDILRTCGRIVSLGVEMVCVSLGDKGAVLAHRNGSAFFAEPQPSEAKILHGAGDAMVAGICKAVIENGDQEHILRCGTAAATAWILQDPGRSNLFSDYSLHLDSIRIRQISP